MHKLQHATELVAAHLDNYRLAEAYDTVYHLVWDDFADWYLEAAKGQSNPAVLAFGLETILKLTHPFAPFVTETIWQTLAWEGDSVLAGSSWPSVPNANDSEVAAFEDIMRVVTEVRGIISALHATELTLYHKEEQFFAEHAELIQRLTRLKNVQSVQDGQGLHLTSTKHNGWLDVSQEAAQKYLDELKTKQDKQTQLITQLEARLANKSYVQNAPHELVEQTKQQRAEAEQLLKNLTTEYERFAGSGS
jgi:valyl-tRNA synthetase